MFRDLAAVLAVAALAVLLVWWVRGHPPDVLTPVPTTTTTDLVHSAQQAQGAGQVGEAVHPVVMRPAQGDQVVLVIGSTAASG
jgi:hypothetical protein